MANPQRVPDPRGIDPVDPVDPAEMIPPRGVDPTLDPRLNPANSQEPYIERAAYEARRGGSGVLIAAVVLVLAVIAYFVFAPGREAPVVPANQPATTEQATPAPDAMAPAPAPDATAPAAPSPNATAPAAPDAMAPAPAPDAAAPNSTSPAPAEPAPAP